MSNRFRPAAAGPRRPLYLRAGQSAGNRQHRLSKANIFALLKYRGTLDESLKTGHCRTLGRIPRRAANAGGAERR